MIAAHCVEDAPCWNWATMGNHHRGIVTKLGNRKVVGPCEYATMRAAKRINLRATPKLKGDMWAFDFAADSFCEMT